MSEHTYPGLTGAVPVDSAAVLIVDPVHLPDDLRARLLAPNEHGVILAAEVVTPSGDGWFDVVSSEEHGEIGLSRRPMTA